MEDSPELARAILLQSFFWNGGPLDLGTEASELITISDAMLDVKEATQVALSYFEDLYGEDAFSNVLLEEVEREEDDDTPYWLITIGFTETKSGGPMSALASNRRYKRFKVDAETGEVLSMKIRSVENA